MLPPAGLFTCKSTRKMRGLCTFDQKLLKIHRPSVRRLSWVRLSSFSFPLRNFCWRDLILSILKGTGSESTFATRIAAHGSEQAGESRGQVCPSALSPHQSLVTAGSDLCRLDRVTCPTAATTKSPQVLTPGAVTPDPTAAKSPTRFFSDARPVSGSDPTLAQ